MTGPHVSHSQSHAHVTEAPGTEVPGANPVLDIGDEVGAMVVYLDGPTGTGELEACPIGRPAEHFHTGVHPRDLGGETVMVAVFPEVVVGSYHILDDAGVPVALVHVRGGEVAEVDLRAR
jgi:hypothetical protein